MPKLLVKTAAFCAIASASIIGFPVLTQDDRPAGAGDSILAIPVCTFTEYEDGYDFIRSTTLGLNAGSGNFYAPVTLPEGSVIRKIKLICLDLNDSAELSLSLIRDKLSSAGSLSSVALALVSSTGSDNVYRTFATQVTSGYVNNRKCVYRLRAYFKTYQDLKLLKAQVVYTPPS